MSSSDPSLSTSAGDADIAEAVVSVESPHVVRYRVFLQRPGETQFTEVAAGTQPGGRHSLGPVPSGSEVGGSFTVAGTPRTSYRIRLSVKGRVQPDPEAVLSGTTDGNGADARSATVRVP